MLFRRNEPCVYSHEYFSGAAAYTARGTTAGPGFSIPVSEPSFTERVAMSALPHPHPRRALRPTSVGAHTARRRRMRPGRFPVLDAAETAFAALAADPGPLRVRTAAGPLPPALVRP